jgi:chaperonin GroEL
MNGVDQLADVIGSTMSIKGRNVIIERDHGTPLVINDGVTIASEIFFSDPVENMGAQLLKGAAAQTDYHAGDGTSGTIVLGRAILKEGWKAIEEGENPVLFRKDLNSCAEKVLTNLKKSADNVNSKKRARQIATVSVQDEALGEKIGDLMYELGASGAVTVKNAIEPGVYVEKDAGLRLEGQLVAGMLDNEDKWETKMSDLKVIMLQESPEDHEFESKWVPFLRQLTDGQVKDGKVMVTKVYVPTLLVVAEKLSRKFIMFMNQNKEVIKWVWFRPTTAGKNMKEVYKDVQGLIGGQIINEEEGVSLSRFNLTELGKAESAIINRHELVLTVASEQLKTDQYLDRVNAVKGQIDNAEDPMEQDQIKERYANLTGGVATIKVNAATNADNEELKLRIEDAIKATRSAMEEGYVSGGGVALFSAARYLEGKAGQALKTACESVIRQILHNAGVEDHDKILKKLEDGEGYDVLTDTIVNMKEHGIIDPLKVIRMALTNAVSAAGLLLTSEYAITNEEDDVEQVKKFFKG